MSTSAATSPTTAADKCRVTRFQCRSMNTKATTDCRITIGAMMISSARAYRPFSRNALYQALKRPQWSDTWEATERRRAMPVSSVVMVYSWRDHQPVADAAHGLHDQRIGRIQLDLAPQAIDLNIHGALVDRTAGAGERHPRHGLAGSGGQHRQHLAFAVGEPDHLVAAAKLGPPEMKHELPEPDAFGHGRSGRFRSAQDACHPQRQFARLERLGDIIVGANF